MEFEEGAARAPHHQEQGAPGECGTMTRPVGDAWEGCWGGSEETRPGEWERFGECGAIAPSLGAAGVQGESAERLHLPNEQL